MAKADGAGGNKRKPEDQGGRGTYQLWHISYGAGGNKRKPEDQGGRGAY